MSIRSVGLSSLRDDWFAVNVAGQDEDPILWCVFKTEFVTHLLQQTNGGVTVNIGSQIEYSKKKDKKAVIKFVKDESVQRGDNYKSHTVSVASGDPPSSRSMPPAPRKAGIAKPISSGKLLKAGGPANAPVRKAQPRALPANSAIQAPRPVPTVSSTPAARLVPNGSASIPKAPPAPKPAGSFTGLPAAIPQPPMMPGVVKPAVQASVPKAAPSAVNKAPPPPPPSRKPAAPPAKPKYKW
jgi:myosin-1